MHYNWVFTLVVFTTPLQLNVGDDKMLAIAVRAHSKLFLDTWLYIDHTHVNHQKGLPKKTKALKNGTAIERFGIQW